MSGRDHKLFLVLSLLLTLALTGCSGGPDPAATPPAPAVTVSFPLKKQVTDFLEYTGETDALESVDIRARVQGFLDKMAFQPGAMVKAGDLLFVIDPRPYKARVDQDAAKLKAKEASYELARVRADKSSNLLTSASIAELSHLEEIAKRNVAQAEVGMAQADLEEGKLQLDYCDVRSPINGRAGRNLVDIGNLVGAADKTLLTTVVNDSSVYVFFNVSEDDLLMLLRKFPTEPGDPEEHKPRAPVFMSLGDEKDYLHQGRMDFADNKVDRSTGTLRVRAIFPNENGFLKPGLFCRIRVPLQTREALLVPNTAIGIDQAGRYVLAVTKDDVVEQKPVQIGKESDGMVVIEKGLSESDRIIVNGIQRARPGAKVKPTQASPPAAETPAKTKASEQE
jgi:membrane fusion protein, multidrug efflux system